jgi:YebC/PmpR family DNA-binding regulatory protein
MSGHNRWSKIKHKKGAGDAKRGKMFTKIIKEITVAARLGGGDADGNPRLRRALVLARGSNMQADTVARAIKKGTGELEGVAYEELTYEGVGPAGVLLLIDAMTDNRNRTFPELRKIFDVHNGTIGSSGSAAWAFEEKGLILLPKDAGDEETVFEAAVGAGAENVEDGGEHWVVTTEKTAVDAISKTLDAAGLKVVSAEWAKLPKNKKSVEGRDAEVLMNLVEALEDHDDVQKVFADFELSDAALAALG